MEYRRETRAREEERVRVAVTRRGEGGENGRAMEK